MRFVLCTVLAVTAAMAFGQGRPLNDRGAIRVEVFHADPYAVKALLEGITINQPELSTILGFAGVPDKDSELITSIFGGKGKFVVNPMDNSLIFIPDKG